MSGREKFDQDGGIEAARGGKALASAGKYFAVDGDGRFAGHGAPGESCTICSSRKPRRSSTTTMFST